MGTITEATRLLAAAIPFPAPGPRRFLGWGDSYFGGSFPWRLPDEQDYRTAIGDGSGTSIVVAGANWIAREIIPARRVVLDHGAGPIPAMLRDHPALELLRHPTRARTAPSGYYGGTALTQALAASWILDGNAYGLKMRSRAGQPVQYWYVPHWMIEPKGGMTADGEPIFIDHYDYTVDGRTVSIDVRDVDHLRFGLDPHNPRKGLSPLRGVLREIYTDEEAGRFSAAIMHNLGFPGAVVIPGKDVTITEESGKEIRERFDQRFGGSNRGKTIVLSANAEVKYLQWSPQELALGDLRDVPEERISAAMGIPAAVLGLGTGLQQVKVGATMQELRSMAWEGVVVPFLEALAENETAQLMPEFADPRRYEISWDLSRIAALSDVQLKRAQVERELVGAGIKQVDEARMSLGLPPVGGPEGGFQPNPGVGAAPRPGQGSLGAGPVWGDRGDIGGDSEGDSADVTLREKAVIAEVAKGRTNKAIADALRTSERSVQRIVSRAMRKLGASSRAELVARLEAPMR